jgi:1-acyl-sn-glycerol-3-phosphate acyltransferase
VQPSSFLLAALAALWIAFAFLARAAASGPRDDLLSGSLLLLIRVYFAIMNRPRYEGLEHLREGESLVLRDGLPLIIVSNHTAGLDPLLIQNATSRIEPRWMMAADMQVPALDAFWRWARIISVARTEGDAASAREALRHLAGGGVLGIFPEGGIERPPRELLPFLPGVGLLIRRSGAAVLPVVIEGTPQVDPAFASFWHTGRPRVRFMPIQRYADTPLRPAEILSHLQGRYQAWTGWPINEHRTDGVGAARVREQASA